MTHAHVYSDPTCRCGACGPAITAALLPNTDRSAWTYLADGVPTNFVLRKVGNSWQVRKTDGLLYGGDLHNAYRTRRAALLYIKGELK